MGQEGAKGLNLNFRFTIKSFDFIMVLSAFARQNDKLSPLEYFFLVTLLVQIRLLINLPCEFPIVVPIRGLAERYGRNANEISPLKWLKIAL